MAPALFLTGVTGYVGGDFLYRLHEKHPEWDVTAMVRNSDKGAKVAKAFPKVKLVYGDLDSADLLEEEASKADIVYQFADSDHEAGTASLITGIKRSSKPEVFYIHTSGTGILTFETIENDKFGEELSKQYNDWDGIQELWSLPDQAPHRAVDKIVQAAWSDKVKTAIVCPPCIYGPGRGPDNQKSIQTPKSVESFLKHKQGWVIRKGKNVWHEVHVQDLSDLYLAITEAAVNGGSPATWNDQGYYFAENGEFAWGDILRAAAKDAHKKGFVSTEEAVGLNPDEIGQYFTAGHFYVGTNSRGVSKRGKQLLGWKPSRPSLLETIPDLVDREARALGLTQGHAAQVSS